MSAPVGIDLGTSACKVARLGADGKPEDVPNAAGQSSTPSAFLIPKDGHEILFGVEAENSALLEPDAFVSGYKRFIGDPSWGFQAPDERRFSATDLSALALQHLLGDAERYLREKVTELTLSVPANFNDGQRREMVEVAKAAGVSLLSIVNEPTAAAVHYALDRKPERPILVYDMGGGTFDATVVGLQDDKLEVLASEGIARCGGLDQRAAIEEHCLTSFERELGFRPNLQEHAAFIQEVRIAAERAKRSLSVRRETVVTASLAGKVLVARITRDEYDALIRPLAEQTIETCRTALAAAGLDFAGVDVVLVGGASRTPLVAQLLKQVTGREPRADVNPDHAVARGAAIEAALQLRDRGVTATANGVAVIPPAITKTDVTPQPLGCLAIDQRTGVLRCVEIVPKNDPLPADRTDCFDLQQQGQDRAEIVVVQGEQDAPPERCHQIGRVQLRIDPRGPVTKRVRVNYAYDANGIVHVRATDTLSGQEATVDLLANGQGATP